MVSVLGQRRLVDEVVVLDQLRIPLVRRPTDEPVEPVEPEAERPRRAIGSHVERIDRHVVVLADPERRIPGLAQAAARLMTDDGIEAPTSPASTAC